MFVIRVFSDTVDLMPHTFGPYDLSLLNRLFLVSILTTSFCRDDKYRAMVTTIKKRYLNRVIPNMGLVVQFYEFIRADTAVVR
jgi:DNA-directed RNA polymerase subunit E'/Rpb7